MHVDAFFEYLIGRQSAYWTEIPPEHIPIADLERDGVAAEDDMALRALLPHIKPRRGRKRPDDDETGKSPSQRPSPQADEYGGGQANTAEPWTAQPDGRGSVFLFPPVPDPSRLNPSAPSWANDIVQTPMTAYPIPQSAITPSTRNAFWADEPKSAITPSKRSASRRHGAKVVSSAWRSGGIGATGKTRGRPPINRGANNEGPFSAFPTSEGPIFRFPSPTPDKNAAASSSAAVPTSNPTAATSATTPQVSIAPAAPPPQPAQSPSHLSPIQESAPGRPAKRRMLSLQVPERKGGEVRLATPPLPEPTTTPVVMVNGQTTESHTQPTTKPSNPSQPSLNTFTHPQPTSVPTPLPTDTTTAPPAPANQTLPPPDPTDRTNIPALEALFVSTILSASWFDAHQNPIPACGVDEAFAFSQTVVENLLKTATTKEAFLINLAGLAGGQTLLHRGSLRITRVEELHDRTRYACAWQLRFGGIVGDWGMEETVLHGKWKRGAAEGGGGGGDVGGGDARPDANGNGKGGRPDGGSQGECWEKRYKELAATLQKRDEEMMRLKGKIIESVREH